MKLQARILIIFGLIFCVIAVGLTLERALDLDRTSYVLKHELSQHREYSDKIVQLHGQDLETLSLDYSFWDDMVSFVKTGNKTFARDNIDTGITTFGADAAWVYRTDYTLVYSVTANGNNDLQSLGLPSGFFAKLSHDKLMHFFLQTPKGLMEIRAATIHPGDDSARLTAPQGFWLVGKYWNNEYLNDLTNLTQNNITTAGPDASLADQIGGQQIGYGERLTDWDGKTVATLVSTATVSVAKDLEALYFRQFALLMIVMFTTIIIILVAIWRLVLAPLNLINRSIEIQKPESLDRLAGQATELGSLAQTVQLFYRQELKIKDSEFVKQKLEDLNKSKSEFLAIAAHELKGPVGNIHIFSENLADIVKDGASTDVLLAEVERISQQAHRATLLVNDIYQASKGGQVLVFNRTQFAFDTFVQREVEDAQYSTQQRIHIEGSTGKDVVSDVDRLAQVTTNLIRNAAKYSPPTTDIYVRLSYDNNNSVVVEVQDSGLGISAEDMPKIFDRFFRANEVATSYPGLGLGLSVCKEIVEGLGGKIWLKSEQGKGSSFYFSLPVAPEQHELS